MSRYLIAVSAVLFASFLVLEAEAVNNGEPCTSDSQCVKNAYCWKRRCNCGHGYGSTGDRNSCTKLSDTCRNDSDCRGAGTCRVVSTSDQPTTPRVCLCPSGWTGSRCEAKIVSGSLRNGVELEQAEPTN